MKEDDPNGEYRLVVRFPGEMGFKLRDGAMRNRRSINNEILFLVEHGMKSASAPQAEKGNLQ